MSKRKTRAQKRGSQASQASQSAKAKVPAVEAIEQKPQELKAVEVDKPVEVPKPFETVKPYEEKEIILPELLPIKDKDPEATETVEEIKEPQYLDKFWFGNVFVPGVGVVSGRVRDDHFEIFKKKFESGQSKLPKADRLELNIDYWVRNNDELEKKLKEGKKRKSE